MNSTYLIFITFLIILAAGAIAFGASYFWHAHLYSNGTYGKKIIGSILRRYAMSRNFKVLDNVTITDGGRTLTIDYVLVGFFGVLFVTVLQGKGEFYGDLKENKWTFSDKGTRVSFDNPVLANQDRVDVFRRTMSKKKIYKLPVESVVTVVGYGKSTPIYLSNNTGETMVYDVAAFRKLLNQVRFEKDNNLNVEELSQVIRGLK